MLNTDRLPQLTDREFEILRLLAEGGCNKQIAGMLGITVHTVKFHNNNIDDKLAVNSRSEAVAWAWKECEED